MAKLVQGKLLVKTLGLMIDVGQRMKRGVLQVRVDAIHVGGKWLECGSRQRILLGCQNKGVKDHHLYNMW